MTTLATNYATGSASPDAPATAMNKTNTQVNLNTSAITTLQGLVPSAPLIKSNNLSDLNSASTARTNLGLGSAATLASSAVAQTANNLSDLASASTARTNLGLGGAAVLAVGTTTGTVAAGDDSRITGAAQKSSNLSDLASASTARTNLGLGGAATLSVGTTTGTVAAGDDSRITGSVQKSVVTAKGDLIAATASGAVTNVAVGADGKALTADSSQSAGMSYRDKSFFTQFPPFEVEVGAFLASASSGATGTANAYSSGRMYLEPIDICKTMTFDRVGTSITATGTGSGQVIRLGLYADDGTFSRPSGAALYDWGTVDSTSGTGDKLITINQQLSAGRYWLAWAIQGTVTTSPTVVTNNIVNQAGLGNLGNNSNRVWGMSGVSGALPTISGLFRDSNPPMIGVRRSA